MSFRWGLEVCMHSYVSVTCPKSNRCSTEHTTHISWEDLPFQNKGTKSCSKVSSGSLSFSLSIAKRSKLFPLQWLYFKNQEAGHSKSTSLFFFFLFLFSFCDLSHTKLPWILNLELLSFVFFPKRVPTSCTSHSQLSLKSHLLLE